MLVMAAKAMEEEIGDATNFVIILAGELLNLAEQLVHMGVHTSYIIQGYLKCSEAALEILPELVVKKVEDIRNAEQVDRACRSGREMWSPTAVGWLTTAFGWATTAAG